jgi:hypothetical protein
MRKWLAKGPSLSSDRLASALEVGIWERDSLVLQTFTWVLVAVGLDLRYGVILPILTTSYYSALLVLLRLLRMQRRSSVIAKYFVLPLLITIPLYGVSVLRTQYYFQCHRYLHRYLYN